MDISILQSNLEFIKSLYFHKEWKDEHCKDDILEAIEECNTKIMNAFGESMHTLWYHKPSIEAVEKVVNKFPSTLTYEDEDDGMLPIHTAATTVGYKYVPVLAKEGIKHNVGGEDARGGLLLTDPSIDHGCNILQLLSTNVDDDDDDYVCVDSNRLNVMIELQRSDLLLKNDIREHDLLHVSCFERTKERFEYLVNWDPDALIEAIFENKSLLHSMSLESDDRIILALKTGFEYHPTIGGSLFV
ncbi:hypothetical protein CTEN210_06376 [Chaetoceros tenuissimus]|uniref:Uncharacterized protein n=1 Tax=Chaetoceros tenuissimus TaxID=426638 RepID=A0AAD3CRU4_9STRA|nr:hypothetical protein CTEN210_06376 [Chaetoceros tenuissimus]